MCKALDRVLFNDLHSKISEPCRCSALTAPCAGAQGFSTHRGERSQHIQHAGICPALPSLPSTASWDHAGTCTRVLCSEDLRIATLPKQSPSRPIYYCHTSAKELMFLLAILGNQEVTNRLAENAKGLVSAAHHFPTPEQSPQSWLLRMETARAKEQSSPAGLLWSCSAFPGICQQGH